METISLYFKRVDRASAREAFLEKEMLESDVRHLEVRTGFYDKLVVLAAGSLAVGISFLASGEQQRNLRQSIHQSLWLAVASFGLVLLSLFLCILHNFYVSRAVTYLSNQIEQVYHEANEYLRWVQGASYNEPLNPSDPAYTKIEGRRQKAKNAELAKTQSVARADRAGQFAVILLVLGYTLGLGTVVAIINASSSARIPPARMVASPLSQKK